MEINELVPVIESLLLVAAEPLSADKIREITGGEKKTVQQAIEEIKTRFDADFHGIKLAALAGGYRLITNQENAPWVKKLLAVKSSARLSKPGLETLSIIAYKQPVIRADIEEIRGVDCGGVLKTLLERRLIKIVGRKDIPGRPILYGTTKEFLQYFGLNNLSDLPTLKEFREENFPDEPEFVMEEAGGAVSPQVEVISGAAVHQEERSGEGLNSRGNEALPENGGDSRAETLVEVTLSEKA